MGIRKDLKRYIKDLESKDYTWLYADGVVERLEKILEKDKNKRDKKRNYYTTVPQLDINDNGDTFEAIKDGCGLPPIGYKYVKIRK